MRVFLTLGSTLLLVFLASCSPPETVERRIATSTDAARPEPREGPGPDFPEEAMEWHRLHLVDEHGQIPPDGLLRAAEERERNLAWQDSLPRPFGAGVDPDAWQFRGPFDVGGRTRALNVDPRDSDVLLAGSATGGIWRTTDGGATWTPVDDFLPSLGCSTIVRDPFDPDLLYAGSGEGYFVAWEIRGAGIFRSTDGGLTFSQMPSTSGWGAVNRIALSPVDSSRILAAGRTGGVQLSTDGGASWQRVINAANGYDVRFDPNDPQRALAVAYAVVGGGGVSVWFSTDAGASWTEATGLSLSGGLNARAEVRFAPSAPGVVYLHTGSNGGELWRSDDGGESYSFVSQRASGDIQWYANTLWVSPVDANHVIIGSVPLYRSWDGGQSWQPISGTPGHVDHHWVAADPGYDGVGNTRAWITNDGGIYRTDELLASPPEWFDLNFGYATTQFYGADGHERNGLLAGGTQDNGSIAVIDDDPVSSHFGGGDGGFTHIDPLDPSYVYAESQWLGLKRSSNGGFSSVDIDAGLPDAQDREANFIAPFALDPSDPRRLLAGGLSLWIADDARAVPQPSWRDLTGPGSGTNYVSAVAVAPSDGAVIWYARNRGQVEMTVNGLDPFPTWTIVDDNAGQDPLPNRMPEAILIDPDDPNRVTISFGGFRADNLWRTDDGGAAWRTITGSAPSNLPSAPIRDVARHPLQPDWLYAATEVGLYTSIDDGATWSASNEGPANVPIHVARFVHESCTLLLGTYGRGLWTTDTMPRPATFVHLSPGDGTQAAGTERTLDWEDAVGADTYRLYFGEVDPPPLLEEGLAASERTVTDLQEGTLYFWRVEAVNDCGVTLSDSGTWSFGVGSQAFSSEISALASACAGTGQIYRTQTTGGVEPYDFEWDFGDGSTSSTPTPFHIYASPGEYEIVLVSTDATGTVAESRLPVVVAGSPPPEGIGTTLRAQRDGEDLVLTWLEPPSGAPGSEPAGYGVFSGGIPDAFFGLEPEAGLPLPDRSTRETTFLHAGSIGGETPLLLGYRVAVTNGCGDSRNAPRRQMRDGDLTDPESGAASDAFEIWLPADTDVVVSADLLEPGGGPSPLSLSLTARQASGTTSSGRDGATCSVPSLCGGDDCPRLELRTTQDGLLRITVRDLCTGEPGRAGSYRLRIDASEPTGILRQTGDEG